MGAAKKSQRRAATRYRFKDTTKSLIRFTSNQHRDIHTTKIFDISESGLSFTTSARLAPRIGTVLKMEIAPTGGVQMAVLARVVRIEEPGERSDWAKFPGSVKIGVAFEKLPKQYLNLINIVLEEKVAHDEVETRVYTPPKTSSFNFNFDFSWLEKNLWTFLGAIVVIAASVVLFYYMANYTPAKAVKDESPWAGKFFDKVINK